MTFQSDQSWTPATYRAAYTAWRLNAPANDSEIFRSPTSSGDPCHSDLSPTLQPILRWRSPPTDQPLQSNWRTIPANDNAVPEGYGNEVASEIAPSVNQMLQAVAKVDFEDDKPESRRQRITGRLAVAGDIERQDGIIVRLGSLHFSNGKQMEPCVFIGPDGVAIPGQATMPRGALLRSTDKTGRPKGSMYGSENAAGDGRLAEFMKVDLPRRVSGRRNKRKRRVTIDPPLPPTSMPLNEARAFAGLAPVAIETKPVLPAATPSYLDMFWSQRKTKCGSSGSSLSWEGIADGIGEREAWAAIVAALPPYDAAVLDAALSASTLADVGRAAGYSGAYAGKVAKRVLLAANDNLSKQIKKSSG